MKKGAEVSVFMTIEREILSGVDEVKSREERRGALENVSKVVISFPNSWISAPHIDTSGSKLCLIYCWEKRDHVVLGDVFWELWSLNSQQMVPLPNNPNGSKNSPIFTNCRWRDEE